MTDVKHTLGPWKASRASHPTDEPYDYVIGADFGVETLDIAKAFGRVDIDNYPDAEANARLIAAAPELLEALQCLRSAYLDKIAGEAVFENDEAVGVLITFGELRAAHAAIAKAEGRE